MFALLLGLCAIVAILPAGASAHSTAAAPGSSAGVKGATEKQLRAWETKVLGAAHATEHARQRAEARKLKKAFKSRRFRAWYQSQLRRQRTKARKAAVGPASEIGQWNGKFDLPVFAINSAVLPTGKVLFYAYPNHPDAPAGAKNESWAYLWDPTKGTGDSSFTAVFPPTDPRTGKPVNIWCSGISFLADGRVLVTGGNLGYITSTQTQFSGLNQVYTFNPFNETWTRQPNMAHGRWYPSQMLMPDGRTVIIQGTDENGLGATNTDIEVFTPSSDMDGVGTIEKTGELYGDFLGAYYPHMFWMPSGRGLIAGPMTNDSFYIGKAATTASLTNAPNLNDRRVWGTAVLEPEGPNGSTKVLEIGGADTGAPDYNHAPATKTTELFDEDAPNDGWVHDSNLNLARAHHNTVLLPDESMVTIGGGIGNNQERHGLWTFDDDQKQAELWSPATREWTLGPSESEGRAYHSTAVLLPDGRVMSAGDDDPARIRQTDNAEIYEPPYLHRGERPTLTQAPTALDWDTAFTVTASNDVTKAVLVAPSAVTHAVDMNQRVVELTMTGNGINSKTFRAPPNPDVALPGYYMLFVLNADGVPSIAKWVKLGASPVAVASGSQLTGTAPLTVAFSSAGSSDPDGSITAYAWDLDGDGQFDDSTAANPSFQYTGAGNYSVRLRVTDNRGAVAVSTALGVSVTNPVPPVDPPVTNPVPPVDPPVTNPVPPVNPRVIPPLSGTAGTSKTSTSKRVTATIVRRKGKRVVRVVVPKARTAKAKVKLVLRGRKGHSVLTRTVTLRTGRTTYVTLKRIPARARTVRATLVSLVSASGQR